MNLPIHVYILSTRNEPVTAIVAIKIVSELFINDTFQGYICKHLSSAKQN